jgi:hypothetical protein
MTTHLTPQRPTADATASAPASAPVRRRGYVVVGLVAGTIAAALTLGLVVAAGAAGVSFEVPEGGESIPLLAFPQFVIVSTLLGLLLAAGLTRWAAHPARAFVWVTVALTALSLVPPFVMGTTAATSVCLVVLHLVAAAIVIPAIAGRLRR